MTTPTATATPAMPAATATANISPLRYPGGKTRACKVIESVKRTF